MHIMRRRIRAIPVYFEKYPKTTIAGVVLLCVPFVNPYLRRRAKRELEYPIIARLESGSKPMLPSHRQEDTIERRELKASLMKIVGVPQRKVGTDAQPSLTCRLVSTLFTRRKNKDEREQG